MVPNIGTQPALIFRRLRSARSLYEKELAGEKEDFDRRRRFSGLTEAAPDVTAKLNTSLAF
jgi:hypothetical protein